MNSGIKLPSLRIEELNEILELAALRIEWIKKSLKLASLRIEELNKSLELAALRIEWIKKKFKVGSPVNRRN